MDSPITLADYLLDQSLGEAERYRYLSLLGFGDVERCAQNLRLLAGEPPLTFDFLEIGEGLLDAIAKSADPDASLNNFERFTEVFGGKTAIYHYLLEDPRAMQALAQLFGFSHYLSEILIRNPEYFELVTNFEVLAEAIPLEELRLELGQSLSLLHSREARLDAMRRFKRRQMLRIGLRDMLRLADVTVILEEVTDLADALVEAAFELSARVVDGLPWNEEVSCAPPPPVGVFALGKMGGRELNYSSDIDLMFVAGVSDDRRLTQIAEQTLQNLTQTTGEGYLYRVDMRLRPQGSSGVLAPSLDYCLSYYESWAEPWEWQALIKLRQVAGDPSLGHRFLDFVQSLVYARQVDVSTITEIQHVKRRMESKVAQEGGANSNIKLGRGGIRDVEFTVQLLQLLWGAEHPSLRSGHTLTTLQELADLGKVSQEEAERLRAAYLILRRLENYLQIVDEFPLQTLPEDQCRLHPLARRMGYLGNNPGDSLMEDLRRHQEATREIHERHFYDAGTDEGSGEGLDIERLLSSDSAESQKWLAASGFEDLSRAKENLRLMAFGPAHVHVPLRTRRLFLQIAPTILRTVGESPDPDRSLNFIESFSSVVGNRASFLQSLARNPQTLKALALLGAICEPMMQVLLAHPELFDMLMTPDVMAAEKTTGVMLRELQNRVQSENQWEGQLTALRRYRYREMLRIGVRDLTGEADIVVIQQELSALAEACLHMAYTLTLAESDSPPFSALAVIGMGKLGGQELHYGSDLDVAFVYEPPDDAVEFRPQRLQSFCDRLMRVLSEVTAEGYAYKVDARLRPEGGIGAMARTLGSYEEYWEEWIEAWERLALLRARTVAGDAALARSFVERSQHWNFIRPVDATVLQELQHIKYRVESERAGREDEAIDIKLGSGGLNDIEFTVQWLQLRYGGDNTALRTTNTLDSLDRLQQHGHISVEDGAVLDAAYRFLCRVESRLRIMETNAPSLLPRGGRKLEIVAKSLGYAADSTSAGEELIGNYQRHAGQVRDVFERHFLSAEVAGSRQD